MKFLTALVATYAAVAAAAPLGQATTTTANAVANTDGVTDAHLIELVARGKGAAEMWSKVTGKPATPLTPHEQEVAKSKARIEKANAKLAKAKPSNNQERQRNVLIAEKELQILTGHHDAKGLLGDQQRVKQAQVQQWEQEYRALAAGSKQVRD